MPHKTQIGFKTESTVGTPVTVDRFEEVESFTITPDVQRDQAMDLRDGQWGPRYDRREPVLLGYKAKLVFLAKTKNFGWWLTHIFGGGATSGPGGDSQYTHTGVIGSHRGKSFTLQGNAYDTRSAADRPVTLAGTKIERAEFATQVGGFLKVSLDLDAISGTTATSLASASYVSGAELFSWVRTGVTVGGSAIKPEGLKMTIGNTLKTDSRKLQSSAAKLEQLNDGHREVTWELDGLDWDSLTQFNRVIATTQSDSQAEIIATMQGGTVIGGSTYPSLALRIPKASFDQIDFPMAGPGQIMQKLSGIGLDGDGTYGMLHASYVTADSTA